MLKRLAMLAVMLAIFISGAAAVEYRCPVAGKRNLEAEYTPEQIAKWKYEVQVVDTGHTASLRRCSHSTIEGAVTCDEYEVDHIAYDSNVGIKKYYYFRGQFDVQIFPRMTFVENNGRGDLAWGTCEIVAQ